MSSKRNKNYKLKDSDSFKDESNFVNLAICVEESLKEWVTAETVELLFGEEEVRKRILEGVARAERYSLLCKKLNRLQLEEEKQDRAVLSKEKTKPLPHYSVLQEEGKKMELKVRAFFEGRTTIELHNESNTETDKDDESSAILPLTEAHAPKALRRRIFLDKLNKVLSDLLRTLAGRNHMGDYVYDGDRCALVKVLVHTFSLSPTNIIFRTAEWTLVGLVIIKMLSLIDPHMKMLLDMKQASMYISMILMSYRLDSNYLDALLLSLSTSYR